MLVRIEFAIFLAETLTCNESQKGVSKRASESAAHVTRIETRQLFVTLMHPAF